MPQSAMAPLAHHWSRLLIILRKNASTLTRQLTSQQWASLALLLYLLWRCRSEIQREIFFWASRFFLQKDFRKSKLARDVEKFSEFNQILPKWLSEGLKDFPEMKPIQRKVLPLALAGKDVVAIAPTGSGKTLAFLVPAMVHASQRRPRFRDGPVALVLAPTRELVLQIHGVAQKLCGDFRGRNFSVGAAYGGARRQDQLERLKRLGSIQLLVAVVGRLLDFYREGDFGLSRCSFFVLDEGDKMLEEGFEKDVLYIGSEIRRDRQVLFFSATWPTQVEKTAKQLCSKGLCRVTLEEEDESPQRGRMLPPSVIEQVVEVVDRRPENKLPLLLQHLEEISRPFSSFLFISLLLLILNH